MKHPAKEKVFPFCRMFLMLKIQTVLKMSVADAWASGNSFRCVPVASGNSCANVRHLPCLLQRI